MARVRSRACLEHGLKLDLNQLARLNVLHLGSNIGAREISWFEPMEGTKIGSAFITADMCSPPNGWLQVELDDIKLSLQLIRVPRHFGGGQWYFICPGSGTPASVLWMPPGAQGFFCRTYWGAQVGYLSQFGSRIDRAHLGKARIHAKLSVDRKFAVLQLPPKPIGMRWKKYRRLESQFNSYEGFLKCRFSNDDRRK